MSGSGTRFAGLEERTPRAICDAGALPLGYRVENRALHVVEPSMPPSCAISFGVISRSAASVRLKALLDQEDARSPLDGPTGPGKTIGGGLIRSRCHLYKILSIPIATLGG